MRSFQIYALECIQDWVGDVNHAVNFLKVGGIRCLGLCFQSPTQQLISGAADVLMELVQNYEAIQEEVRLMRVH